MKKYLGVIGAVIVGLIGAQLGGLFTKTAIFEGQKALYTEEKLEADLANALPKTMAAMKAAFPDDYDAMLGDILDGVKSSSSTDQITKRSAAAAAAVRRKHSAAIAKAPSTDITALIDGNIRLIEEVRAGEGDELCAAVAAQGPIAVTAKGITNYNATIDETGAIMFRALRAGIDTPVERTPVTDADWAAIVGALQANGMTDEELAVVGAAAQDDPRYCRLILDFVKEVRNTPGDAGDRARAAFAEEAAKG